MNWQGFFIKGMPSYTQLVKYKSLGRIAISRVVAVLIVLFVFSLLSYIFLSRYSHYRALQTRIATVEKELDLLRKDNTRLKHEINMLHTPGRIESLARERLGLTKPGELAFRVTDTKQKANIEEKEQDAAQNEGTSNISKEQKELSWWESIGRRLYDSLRSIFRWGNQGG